MKRENVFAIITASFIIYIISRFIIAPGNYPAHDTTHPARIYLMSESIKSGQFPPIWADQVNFGLGYPLFHLYAPLSYYVGYIFSLLGMSYLVAYEASFILALIISAWGMYKFASRWGPNSALISMAAYLFLPYLAVNIYVRAALAETWSMALLPWLFWIWSKSNSPRFFSRASITTLFILSHNLIPLITFPFLVAWIILNRINLKHFFISGALTILLSSFYLGPLIFERSFTSVEEIARTSDFRLHFVAPWQLWNSTWGFGGSASGVEDGMSFKIGKLHILLALTSLLLIQKYRKHSHTILYFALSALISAFMATSFSHAIWERIALIQVLQFPWRFLALIGFFTSSLSGFFVVSLSKSYRLLGVAIIIFGFIYLGAKYFVPLSIYNTSDSNILTTEYIETTLAKIVPEYQTKWSPTLASAYSEDLFEGKDLAVRDLDVNYNKISATLSLEEDSDITIYKSYYPTWRLFIDNSPTDMTSSSTGLIQAHVPAGTHEIRLIQSNTRLQNFTLALSTATLLGLLIYSFRTKKII